MANQNPDIIPLPGDEEDMAILLQRVTTSLQQAQVSFRQNAELRQRVVETDAKIKVLMNIHASAGNQPIRLKVKLEKYSHRANSDGGEFTLWLQHAKRVISANNWDCQTAIRGMLSSSAMTSVMSEDAAHYHNDLNIFIDALKKKFVTPASEAVARQRFDIALQGAKENINRFHARLQEAYCESYAAIDEPWRFNNALPVPDGEDRATQTGHRNVRLIRQFIRGLSDERIRLELYNSETGGLGPITTYEAAINRALTYLSNIERVTTEREQNKFFKKAYFMKCPEKNWTY